MLAVLDSPRFADKAVAQVYTILLDEGTYLCSQATMHRLLRERGTSGERRAQATHPARKKPELLAAGPDQVWSWDITKLKGPARGIWYLLYVILDIYSRKVIHWEIWPTETGTLAKEFIQNAIAANGGVIPRAVHADRGTSMTSNTTALNFRDVCLLSGDSTGRSLSCMRPLRYASAAAGRLSGRRSGRAGPGGLAGRGPG